MSWPDSNRRPTSVCRSKPTSEGSCQLSYTTHRIYIPSYKQLAATPAYAIRRRAHPHYWTCNQDSVFQFVLYVAVARQPYSAFNSHNLPSDLRYYLPALLFTSKPTRGYCWFGNYLVSSGCTYGLDTVSFHSIFFEVYFAAVSAQGFARASPPFGGSRCHHRYGLLATHLAIVYSVYSAYLPGLHSARPSAFVEGAGVEPAAHPMLFGESPPSGRTAVAFIRSVTKYSPYSNLACLRQLSRLFPSFISATSGHHTPRCEYSPQFPASRSIAWCCVSCRQGVLL